MFSVQNFLYRGLIFLLVFTLAYVFTEWRFGEWMPTVFFGDDLINILDFKAGKFPNTLTELLTYGDGGKFRPVFVGILGFLLYYFNENINNYLETYVILNSLNACIVFAIAYKLSRGVLLVSGSIALVVAASRFSLYQVTQVTGVLEGIGFALFLLTIYCIITAKDSKGVKCILWSVASIIFSILTLHNHERYIGLVLWVPIVIGFFPKSCSLSLSHKITLTAISLASIAFNIFYKNYVLQSSFLMGTGGQKIGFNTTQILNHISQAVFSVIGINEGPAYLAGSRALSAESWPAAILGGVFIASYICIIGFYLYDLKFNKTNAPINKCYSMGWLALFALLAGLLLIPPIMTIRVEHRWLLQPFALLLFSLAWAGRDYFKNKQTKATLAGISLICVFVADSVIAKHFDRVFLVYSGKFASLVKDDLLNSENTKSGCNILIANKDHSKWTLLNNRFFDLYNKTPASFKCVDTLSAAESEANGYDAKFYMEKDGKIADITSNVKAIRSFNNQDNYVVCDFILKYGEGVINNSATVSSPNGRGVFKMPVSFLPGNLEALIVVSGFEYKFENIQIPSVATMEFGLEMYHPSAYPLTASIVIKDTNSHQEVTFTKEIQPRINKDYLTIDPVSIDLSEFSGKIVSIAFSATTKPGHSARAHWAIFASPRIIQGLTQLDNNK